MKNINTILNADRKNLNWLASALVACGALALLCASGCSLRQAYPQTQIHGYINGQPFSITAPKDATLVGFDALTTTNGAIHIHIDSLQCSLNPTNLANAAEGQAAIVTATGTVINQAISQAVQAAAAAGKTAVTH